MAERRVRERHELELIMVITVCPESWYPNLIRTQYMKGILICQAFGALNYCCAPNCLCIN